MELIETVTVGSGGQASIEFTSIAADWTDLYCVVSSRTNDTGGAIFYLRPNGVTTNLTYRQLRGSGSAVASTTAAEIAFRTTSTDRTSNTFGSGSFYIPNYASSSYKSVSGEGVEENNATQAYSNIVAGLWSSTSAITSLTLVPSGGTFLEHSTASLYGIASGSDGTTTVS